MREGKGTGEGERGGGWEEEKQHVYYVIFIEKTKLPQLQKGRVKRNRRGGEGGGGGGGGETTSILCNIYRENKTPTITEREREMEQERGRGRRGKERGRRNNILYLQTNTMSNQGGEKKEHSVPIMMDCVQTTN